MVTSLSRRRFITITAGAGVWLAAMPGLTAETNPSLHHWQGFVMGADAAIKLYHANPRTAEKLTEGCLKEIIRLEKIFSLYDPTSSLYRLNRDGQLESPPAELVDLLTLAQKYGEQTQGAFDVTIQPLWHVYAEHFSKRGMTSPPPQEAIEAALTLVDYRAIGIDKNRITLPRHGMQVTLNGIAQGYITDQVSHWLKQRGIDNVLVVLGETRALGAHPDGKPWQVGIRQPLDSQPLLDVIPLKDAAIATSGAYGTPFTEDLQYHHIINPRSGLTPLHYQSLSVIAPTATMADAFSTALYTLPPTSAKSILSQHPSLKAIFQMADGHVTHHPS